MFTDERSKKVILVAHCVLNQNSKIDRCAWYPGVMVEVTQTLINAGVGIIQMPCPELMHLGLDRQAEKWESSTIESEDTRVAARMNESPSKIFCQRIADDLVCQIGQYQQNGFSVLGILGINGSPTCGVETRWTEDHEESGYGVFIQALIIACGRLKITLPMRGIKACDPMTAIAVVQTLL